MKVERSSIVLKNLQIKSENTFHELCKAISIIEEQCGVYEVDIIIENIFFCPWINMDNCYNTYMERLIIGLINKLGDK